ncbi:unnamed protein product [Effrenium voratum]|nr:unnamed protein product [Effrenium voratum]
MSFSAHAARLRVTLPVACLVTYEWRRPSRCEGRLYRQSTDDPQRVLQWHAAHGGFVHGAVRACQLPGLGWALCAQAPVSSGTVLVTTPGSLLWTAFDKRAPQAAPLAPGERLASASAQLRRRLVAAHAAGAEPFVEAMHPPDSIPLQMVAGSVHDPPPEAAVGALKGTTLLQHTLSLRSKLLEAIGTLDKIGLNYLAVVLPLQT